MRKQGYKFYYFHNPDISFADAYQDFVECRGYLRVGGGVALPGFIPWTETYQRPVYAQYPQYGLVGAVLIAIISPKAERGVRSNKMRRCMGTRGYVRYAIPEKTFDEINEGEEAKILIVQAKLATGPKPQDEVVEDD
ncbi:MAG: hypothetical protein HC843_07570 [Sphingomonadales bacterium]|nr:hypothetical protein [Sphingomonadales bacterium]